MKITTKMFYDRFLSGMQENMAAILKGNEQLSTGKKINRPSDDPATISRIVNYKTILSSIAEYKRAIDSAKGPLESIDSSLGNLSDTLLRAHELALSGASDTMDAQSRNMIAKEVSALLENAVGIANTKVGDRYIFAGYQSGTAPIDTNSYEFVGDANSFNIDISIGLSIALNVPASDLFSFKRVNVTDPAGAVMPAYNWSNNGANTIPDADPISALYIATGGFTASSDVLTANGGTLTITAGENDTTPVDVVIAPNSTLQDVRNAINTASAGVKADVVNFGTIASPDFRLVVASSPVGKSDTIKIDVTTTDGAGAGLNRLAYNLSGTQNMVLGTNVTNYNYITESTANDSIVIGSTNNAISIIENGVPATAVIAEGTYTANQLTAAIKNALEGATVSGNLYTVTYDQATRKFNIASNAGNPHNLNLQWADSTTTARQLLGFDAVNTPAFGAGGYDVSDNPVLANYYSYNNNYLNDNYVLRAIYYLKTSLESNDTGRIQKAISYISKASEKVSQTAADVGARLNKIDSEEKYQEDREVNTNGYLSNDQDVDVGKVFSEISQRQVALQGLQIISTDFLKSSLFDFLK